MIVVNLFSGAGCGKSTLAARVFHELKIRGISTELVGEYAKDCVYNKSYKEMADQLWLFANQAHRLRNLSRYGVKVAVCDSPLLLSVAYQKFECHVFEWLVREEHEKYDNLNFFLTRNDEYWEDDRRTGDINNAKEIDKSVLKIIKDEPFETICSHDYNFIVNQVLKKVG